MIFPVPEGVVELNLPQGARVESTLTDTSAAYKVFAGAEKLTLIVSRRAPALQCAKGSLGNLKGKLCEGDGGFEFAAKLSKGYWLYLKASPGFAEALKGLRYSPGWRTFTTERLYYGKLRFRAPSTVQVRKVQGRKYVWYRVRGRRWPTWLNIWVGEVMPEARLFRRKRETKEGQTRMTLAGTQGLAIWGKDQRGHWFEFVSHRLFGRQIEFRVWYEAAPDELKPVLDSIAKTLEVAR